MAKPTFDVQAKFRIEGGPSQIHGFRITSTKEEDAAKEIAALVAGEWKCHAVDVEVLQIGNDARALKDAPEPEADLPTADQVAEMKKAELVVLAKKLDMAVDFDKTKKDDLAVLVLEELDKRKSAA